ncbi:LamB/YcsF family protein [sulfur-oxidizing endosymbiont of Gigantopelta aegis]|uniref:LamB/YcsF family protein n=1 Tax=sulfur-oxidizing endosymbiont of Gigantopelta aegis TaxID=2794934 RepID=UPI0018DDA744|nr:LamB/YcsF family protein [sulfur-oxidizing endosymbiont of Gigantopelta aegis]
MLINCDIGERGLAHEIDDQLMAVIDIANIACGGHAGDEQSIAYYYSLAKEHGVKPSVHLSYPDRENFGRRVISIDDQALLKSLDQQYTRLYEVKTLKLHGALYNEANSNKKLALLIINWAKEAGINEILCPQHSEVARYCSAGEDDPIAVMHEVFLDRRYVYEHNRLTLKSRKEQDALLNDVDEAIEQFKNFQQNRLVIDKQVHKVNADTGCIHSDSEHALDLLRAIKGV